MGGTKWWLVGGIALLAVGGLTWALMQDERPTRRAHATVTDTDTDAEPARRPRMSPARLSKDDLKRVRRAPRRDGLEPVKDP